jgi:hypothetical protein
LNKGIQIQPSSGMADEQLRVRVHYEKHGGGDDDKLEWPTPPPRPVLKAIPPTHAVISTGFHIQEGH